MKDLEAKGVSSLKWSALSSLSLAIIYLLKIVIVSYFISKAELGIASVALGIMAIVQGVVDFGLSNAIIHFQKISKSAMNTMYWMNVLMGVLLGTLTIFFAPIVSGFYENSSLEGPVKVLSLIFFIQPLGQQFKVLLQKDLEFKIVGIIEIISSVLSLLVAIVLAYEGFGALAIIYSFVCTYILMTIGYLIIGLPKYGMTFTFKFGEIKPYISFALYQMGERNINNLAANIDIFTLGKVLGMDDLGVYNLAKQLVSRPMQIINPIFTKVSFPYMSKIQESLEKVKRVYIKKIEVISWLNFSIYIGIAVLGEDIVALIFGDRWDSTGKIIKYLAIAYGIRSVINPVGSLLLALGKVKRAFYWNLVIALISPFFYYLTARNGLETTCFYFIHFSIILLFFNWLFMLKNTVRMSFLEFFKPLFKSFIIASIGSLAFIVKSSLTDRSIIERFSLTLAVGIFLILTATYIIDRHLLSFYKSKNKKF